jgi:hypothetical protein
LRKDRVLIHSLQVAQSLSDSQLFQLLRRVTSIGKSSTDVPKESIWKPNMMAGDIVCQISWPGPSFVTPKIAGITQHFST